VFGDKNHVGIDREHGFLAATPSPRRRRMTAVSSAPCSIAATPPAMCGPTLPIARRAPGPARPLRAKAAIPTEKTEKLGQ